METLDVARHHEGALTLLLRARLSPAERKRRLDRARAFFDATIVAIERTHAAALEADTRARHLTVTLNRRMREASSSARLLKRAIAKREAAEASLVQRRKRQARLLLEAHRLQTKLRDLAHACLNAQEDERMRISRRLNDDVAQRLLGIHVRLLVLKKTLKEGSDRLKKEIGDTQQLVRQSTRKVTEWDHELGYAK